MRPTMYTFRIRVCRFSTFDIKHQNQDKTCSCASTCAIHEYVAHLSSTGAHNDAILYNWYFKVMAYVSMRMCSH